MAQNAILFCIVAAITCATIARRRQLVMGLQWPDNLGYYPFRSRLRSFVARSGFKVKISPEVPFDLEATINGKIVLFICVSDNGPIASTKILDWAELLTYRGKGRQLVCVAARPIHECLAREASTRSFTLLHYKRLKDFLPAPA